MTDKRLILVSNDNGYNAKGIKSIVEWASRYGYVYCVAPAEHQSGKSSAITIDTPLRATTVEKTDSYTIIKVNGTPTDCAKLALNSLLPRRPDLLLSGINHGYNAGNSVIYSGTMGVVFEGCFQNSTRYSEICREFDMKGIGIFNHDIQIETEPDELQQTSFKEEI